VALASNPALEAIVRDHDDDASWQVLEDWLLETNDPRARLVRLEKEGEDTTEAVAELEPVLLGPEEVAWAIEAERWRAGFARRATIHAAATGYGSETRYRTAAELREAVTAIAKAPALALVRDLTLRIEAFSEAVLAAIAEAAPQIESLAVEYATPAAGLSGASLAPFTRLERLRVKGPMVEVRDLAKAASLRHLELALTPRSVASVIAMNPLAELRSLSMVTGALLYPWHGVFDRLFDGTCAPKLAELHLDAAPTSGNLDFLRDLALSPLGARLKRLSLAGAECSPPMLRRLGRSVAAVRDVQL
jgi:uncharacterized protein (TIGR02996 family)